MIVIVGLGNYTKEYNSTRHNIGFLAVDEFQRQNGFSKWEESKKFICAYSDGFYENRKCILIKPYTFMNLSGQSVEKVMHFYKAKSTELIVIHDDIDLPFGKIKISQSRNTAGHNGVKSVNLFIQEPYNRIRIGVGRPENKDFDIANYVLGKFTEDEQTKLPQILSNAVLEINNIISSMQ